VKKVVQEVKKKETISIHQGKPEEGMYGKLRNPNMVACRYGQVHVP
jgi:hypothetical protein